MISGHSIYGQLTLQRNIMMEGHSGELCLVHGNTEENSRSVPERRQRTKYWMQNHLPMIQLDTLNMCFSNSLRSCQAN